MNIILASSSKYRKKLLNPLMPELFCVTPDIDESIQTEESASCYVTRLALQKAQNVIEKLIKENNTLIDNALVIGSDQCAVLNNKIVNKPETHAAALKQLHESNGKEVLFYTGICVVNTLTNTQQVGYETSKVKFRDLSKHQITNYIEKDQPYDCAGSFKVEGLGITLFESIHSNDPNTLIGLPLIRLTSMLQAEGFDLLTS